MQWLTEILTATPQWLLGAGAAIALIILGRLAWRLLLPRAQHGKPKPHDPTSDPFSLLMVGLATVVSAQGVFIALERMDGFPDWLVWTTFFVFEGLIIKFGRTARARVENPPHKPGIGVLLVWAGALASALVSNTISATATEHWVRTLIPIAIAATWTYDLYILRQQKAGHTDSGLTWQWLPSPARALLTRLGFIKVTTRTQDELAVHYHLDRLAEAAFRATNATRMTRRWTRWRLHKVHLEARQNTDLASNPATQLTLVDMLDSLFAEEDLIGWKPRSPWTRENSTENPAENPTETFNERAPRRVLTPHGRSAETRAEKHGERPGEITGDVHLDLQVLDIFERNPQVSVNAVAKELGVSWQTAKNRLKEVQDVAGSSDREPQGART